MAWRTTFGRVRRMRACRALALLGVCALFAQSLPLLAAAESAACCCAHQSAGDACGCPVCAHQRQIQSGHAVIGPCGAPGHATPFLLLDAALLSAPRDPVSPSAPISPLPVASSPQEEPAVDVPTPPPLARV